MHLAAVAVKSAAVVLVVELMVVLVVVAVPQMVQDQHQEHLETKEDIVLQKEMMVQRDIILVAIPQVEVVVLVVLVILLEAIVDLVEMVEMVIPTLILRHLMLHLL